MEMADLTAVCTGLGSVREDEDGREVYVKHADCLVNLKHLQRFLRRDNPTNREIFMQLGKWNTIRQDILPIIDHYRDNYDLVLNAVKVMVFLTMPVDSSSTNIPQQLDYLRNFKAAVLEDDIAIGVVVSHLQEPLEHMESGAVTDTDGKMFQLVLTLIRNFLAIDDSSSPFTRSAASSNSHASYLKDELLERLFKENVTDLLLALTQHVGGDLPFLRQDNLLILEIFNHLIWGQMPNIIASSGDKLRKETKSSRSSAAIIESLISHEREEKQRKFAGSRHSNFTGTFVRVEKDGTKTLLTRNPYQSPLDNLFQKPEIKRGQVKKVATDLPLWIPSNATVCGLLKSFADQFLEGSYNRLMETVKDDIRSERNNVQPQDIVMFFSVASFFTAYQRCLLLRNQAIRSDGENQSQSENVSQYESDGATFQGQCGRIASTMDEDMFTLITEKWQSFVEVAKTTNDWLPPTTAGVLLKEMIHMLDYVLKAADRTAAEGQQEVRVARILLFKVFYDQTEDGILPFIFRLIKTFDVHKQPRSQLAGLIETAHIVLRLLDSITKEDGALRVKKKARKVRKKGTSISQKETARSVSEEKDDADPPLSKSNVDPSVCGIRNSETEPEVDEVGRNTESEIQDNSKEPSTGVQATERDTQSAGDLNSKESPDGVPVLDLGTEVDGNADDSRVDKPKDLQDQLEEVKSESEADDDGSEEEEEVRTKEETLDVLKCVKIFADNTVLHNYCWLLKNYTHNTAATNYYIIRMLQRICQDCMMEPMLYQLSVLQTCYEILSNKSIPNSEQHQFVVAFLTKLVRHLFQKLKRSPLLFVDLLFWKSKQDCHCITADYIIHDLKKSALNKDKSAGRATDFQDRKALLDSLGDDDDGETESHANVPHVENLYNSNNCVPRMDGGERGRVKRQKVSKRKGPFSDYEEDLIKDFFEKHKENRSCSKLIARGLAEAGAVQDTGDDFTPAQVGRALKRLGLERVVKKKSTNKLLEGIGSDDDSKKESEAEKESKASDVEKESDSENGSDEDEENAHCTRNPKKPSIMDIDSDEDTLVKQSNMHAKVPVESELANSERLDSDSNKEENTKEAGDGEGDTNREGGVKSKSRKAMKKRTSGDLCGNDDCGKWRRKSGLFSEEQDQQLRSLFEKYKGMTTVKHLISNELEGLFTPLQISRRLQQLGCVQPKKRKTILAEILGDEDKNLKRKADFHGSHGFDGECGDSEDDGRDFSSDQRHASGEGLNAPSISNSGKDKEAGIPYSGAFRASWGSLARKNAQKKVEHPITKQNKSGFEADGDDSKKFNASDSDNDLLCALKESRKKRQQSEKFRKKDASESDRFGGSDSDDDQPIGQKENLKNRKKFNASDSEDDLLSAHKESRKKILERKKRQQPEKFMNQDATDGDRFGDSYRNDDLQIGLKTSLGESVGRKKNRQALQERSVKDASERDRSGASDSRDDQSIGQEGSIEKTFEKKKRLQPEETLEKRNASEGYDSENSESDDDQPIRYKPCFRRSLGRRKKQQLQEVLEKKDATDKSGDSDRDDGQPIEHKASLKETEARKIGLLPEEDQEKKHRLQLEDEAKKKDSSDCDGDQPIGLIATVKKTFKRKKKIQHDVHPEKVGSESNRYGGCDSEDSSPIGENDALKKSYERKKRLQAVQKPEKMATWGDSDTDASDIK